MRWEAIAIGMCLFTAACGSANDDTSKLTDFARRNSPVSQNTWANVHKLSCTPKVLDICDETECNPVRIDPANPPVKVMWYPTSGDLERCDNNVCETYNSTVTHSGLFTSVRPQDRDHLFRVSSSGEYREIAHLVNATWLYRGQCERIAGP
ncbi:hypothetical protein [Caenibius sp. WL]|uniref:hypothetical protein n=1 Tax=Caenibius sp. WL TaxID=2872646 RepID=UPI001C9A1AB3|nr:hypothetical protein [Caenibius sp. WL]QZP07723.1 hypothetical protein K5X80_13870 [Caenibius sp. WL]